jgi:hypothetical protein
MDENETRRREQAEAWKRSRAAELARRHDEEDRRDRWRLYFATGAFMLAVLGIIGCLVHGARGPEEVAPPAEVYDGPPEVWATDAAGEGKDAGAVPAIARPMPNGPIEGQKRGKCADDERSINGGCWMELVRKPGTDKCGSKGFEYEGKCWVPVKQAERPPTSVEP